MERLMVSMSSGGITPKYNPKDNIIPEHHQTKGSNTDVKSHLTAIRSHIIKNTELLEELELEIANIDSQNQLLNKEMKELKEKYEFSYLSDDTNQLSDIKQKMDECITEKRGLKKKKQDFLIKVNNLVNNLNLFPVNLDKFQSTIHLSKQQLQKTAVEIDTNKHELEDEQENLSSKQSVLDIEQTPVLEEHGEVEEEPERTASQTTSKADAEEAQSSILADKLLESLNTLSEAVVLPKGEKVIANHLSENALDIIKEMNTYSHGQILDITGRMFDFTIQKRSQFLDEHGNLHVTAAPGSLLREGQQVRVERHGSFQNYTIAKVKYCSQAEWQEIQRHLFRDVVNYLIQNPSLIIFHKEEDEKNTEMHEVSLQGISNQTDSSPLVHTSLTKEEHTFKMDLLVIATMMTALIEQVKHVLKVKDEDHQKYLESLDFMLHKIKLGHIAQEELKAERVKDADQQVAIKEKVLLQFLLNKDEWKKELSKITRTYILIPVEGVLKFLTFFEKTPHLKDSKEARVLIHTVISFALALLRPVHINEKSETTHSIDRTNIIK